MNKIDDLVRARVAKITQISQAYVRAREILWMYAERSCI